MRVPGIPYVQGKNSYKDGDGKHYAFAIHNTSNDASDTNEASFATRRPDGVSSHFYCDKDSVTQSLDTNARAGHAGSRQGNENAIAIEITGANAWKRDRWLRDVAWDKLGRVLAYVILHDPDYKGFQLRFATVAEMKANPKVKAFYTHNDMRLAWGGTDHTDPGPGFDSVVKNRLIKAVKDGIAALTGPKPEEEAAQPERKDPDMLMLQLKGQTTVWLTWGPDRGRVALVEPGEMPSGVPFVPVSSEARLTELGGPVITPPTVK